MVSSTPVQVKRTTNGVDQNHESHKPGQVEFGKPCRSNEVKRLTVTRQPLVTCGELDLALNQPLNKYLLNPTDHDSLLNIFNEHLRGLPLLSHNTC